MLSLFDFLRFQTLHLQDETIFSPCSFGHQNIAEDARRAELWGQERKARTEVSSVGNRHSALLSIKIYGSFGQYGKKHFRLHFHGGQASQEKMPHETISFIEKSFFNLLRKQH